jgi:hypothetical protein
MRGTLDSAGAQAMNHLHRAMAGNDALIKPTLKLTHGIFNSEAV